MRGVCSLGGVGGAVLVVAVLGCESQVAETRQYAGTSVTSSAPVGKGAVTITNANGAVWVDTASESGALSVTGVPFATGADDAAARAAAVSALSSLKLSVLSDGQGGVTVTGGGDATKGFDLAVHLPYPFDGQLTISAQNGYVHYVGSSGSKGVTINVENGDIFVQDGGQNLQITGGTSNIDVITLPTVTGTTITTNVGDISAQIPNASVLLITATVVTGGTVTPPPNKSVELGDDDDDDDDDGTGATGTAVSTVSADHKSATIQLGTLASIQALKQYMQVRTGDGNIVFF
jgi:hypothetical protein